MTTLKCAQAPCKSCPYRRDVPSGVWAPHEYEKLPHYDGEMVDQLYNRATGLFDCHQRDGNLCAGWIATHGANNLLAFRLHGNDVDPSLWNYQTKVPVFASGREACDHGKKDMDNPRQKARNMIDRLVRKIT